MNPTSSKSADRLLSQLGGNMRESMSTVAAGATGPLPTTAASAQYQGTGRARDALMIERDRIIPDPAQPRRTFDEGPLAELAESLKGRGQLQPIRVRYSADLGKWVIIAGERRWRAAGMAGLSTLACVEVKGELPPDLILEDQLIENCIREDLKPLEAARAFDAMMKMRGLSLRQLGDYLQTSHARIQKAVDLLKLPAPVQEMVEAGDIAPAVANEVGRAPAELQAEIAAEVVERKLTREETNRLVKERTAAGPKGRGARAGPPKPRTFRVAGGGVVVTMKRDGSAEAIRAALAEAMAQLDAAERSRGEVAA